MLHGYGLLNFTSVPDYMPQRKPLDFPLDALVIHKMKWFGFGTPEYIRQELTRIANSSGYHDSVAVWMNNKWYTSSAVPKLRLGFRIRLAYAEALKRAQSSDWEGSSPDFNSLDFYELVRSRVVSPLLAVYYLVMEQLEREKSLSSMAK